MVNITLTCTNNTFGLEGQKGKFDTNSTIPGEAVATAEGQIVIRHLRVSGSPSEQRQIESIASGQIKKRETDTCEH